MTKVRTYFMASDILIEKVKEFEGYRSVAYNKLDNVWTVGYGHTAGVKPYQRTSREQAETWLKQDLAKAANYVNKQQVCKTQGQFDALTDFAFNLGTSRLGHSTLLYKIRTNAPTAEIQAQFRRWVYSNHVKLPGLVKRREWEAQRWVAN